MTKGEQLAYSIEAACSQLGLARWCSYRNIDVADFMIFIEAGQVAVDKND